MHVKIKSSELYKQIYDLVLAKIDRKEWKEHEKLPSVRRMAEELKVNRLTVLRAYQLLKEHKKIYAKEKSGYFVKSEDPSFSLNESQLLEIADYPYSHLLSSSIHQVAVDYQFSQAIIDPNLLPNSYLSEYVKKVFTLYPKVLGTYSTVQGDEELRTALSDYFYKTHHFFAPIDELLITSGAQQAIDLVAKALLRANDTVLVERPTYSSAIDIFRQYGARIIGIEIGQGGYDLNQLEHILKKDKPRFFYTNPTFNNPTGCTISALQRKQLVELAEKYQCVIVEDDPFRDIYFDKAPPFPIYSYDTDGYVIYIRSFSKYVSPGLRVAAVACRQPLMSHLITSKSLADNGTALINQKMFLHYFFSERMQIHLEKLRTALFLRKEVMGNELAATSWKWTDPSGGLNLWVELPEQISVEKLLDACLEQSISFVPGSICDPDQALRSWIRLSFSYANEIQLQTGMKKLMTVVETINSDSAYRQ
ncbi:PLP-dependent aminotransferase family protein [Peribacillus frigoritolerans]|uniref:aminotransferase-like domain-containing protein n=1 Tax=Peribacillus frigoritolerans TaxID=450367 RepID=UPI003F87399F